MFGQELLHICELNFAFKILRFQKWYVQTNDEAKLDPKKTAALQCNIQSANSKMGVEMELPKLSHSFAAFPSNHFTRNLFSWCV